MGRGARVRRAVLGVLPAAPNAAVVARLVGMSTRTMQRRLAAEGRSFEAIVETVRREIASAMLSDRAASLEDVARATGFSEASAFSRAYKRWTKKSPRRR